MRSRILAGLAAAVTISLTCLPHLTAAVFNVHTYGATGDDTTNDGPAIRATIEAAMNAGGTNTVEFNAAQSYFIADDPNRWTHFHIDGASNLTIDGKGATLKLSADNYAFFVRNSTNITFKNLTIDYASPSITQGTITAKDAGAYTFDLQIDNGFAPPPTDSHVYANYLDGFPGQGGNHGLLIKPSTYARQETTTKNHLAVSSIIDLGGGIYRFTLAPNYQTEIGNITSGDRFVYNYQHLKLTKTQVRDKIEWHKLTYGSDYNGGVTYTNVADNGVQAVFDGSTVKCYARKGPSAGIANIYIDGSFDSSVDLYSPTQTFQNEIYSKTGLAGFTHSIEVRATGNKNAASTGPTINLDYVTTTGSVVSKDNADAQIAYTGTWPTQNGGADYASTLKYSSTSGNSAVYTFTGSQINYYARKGPGAGICNIYLDTLLVGTIDLYASAATYQQLVYSSNTLLVGSHTLKIEVTGTKNSLATGSAVNVDYLTYTPGEIYDDQSLELAYLSREDLPVSLFKIGESANVLLEGVVSYFSPGKLARVYANDGAVTFRSVSVKRPPASARLLANGSDAIHAKNNRGAVIIEECYFESCNDDMINIATMAHFVRKKISDNKFQVRSLDSYYFNKPVSISPGDTLRFRNAANGGVFEDAVVDIATVDDYGLFTVTLDRNLSWVVEGSAATGTRLWNVANMNPGSSITGNTFQPLLRHAMLTRANGLSIYDNQIVGLGGAGLSLKDDLAGTSEGAPGATNIGVIANTFEDLVSFAVTAGTTITNPLSLSLWPASLSIEGNIILRNKGAGILINNLSGVTGDANYIEMSSSAAVSSLALTLKEVVNANVTGLKVSDLRSGLAQTLLLQDVDTTTVYLGVDQLKIETNVIPMNVSGLLDDTYSAFTKTGNWSVNPSGGDFGGSVSLSSSLDDSASVSFNGDGVQLLVRRDVNMGQAEVFIDGLSKGVVDLYNATQTSKYVIYSNMLLGDGDHEISIVVKHTKNPASTGYAVNLDAVRVYNKVQRVDNLDGAVSYSGTWNTQALAGDYAGALRYAAVNAASATFQFTGSKVAIGARKGPGAGIARVYVDDLLLPDVVDLYSAAVTQQSIVFRSSLASSGVHTIKLEATGTKNSLSSGVAVNVDFFEFD